MRNIEPADAAIVPQVVDFLNVAAFRPEGPVAAQVNHLRPGVGDDVRQAFGGVPAQLELEGVVAGFPDALVFIGRGDVGERLTRGDIPRSGGHSDVVKSTAFRPAAVLPNVVGFQDRGGAERLLNAQVPLLRVGVLHLGIREPLGLGEGSGGRIRNGTARRVERVAQLTVGNALADDG